MKKRICSLLLALVLVATLLPTFALEASAKEYAAGDRVSRYDLYEGDILRKGSILVNHLNVWVTVYSAASQSEPYDTRLGSIKSLGTWTVPGDYLFLKNEFDRLSLYPIPNTYITFNPNGGTAYGSASNSTFQTQMGTSNYCDVSWLNPYRPGCTFLGWYSGSTMIYNANGIMVNDGTYWKNNVWNSASSLTVTAKWQANTSVTFQYFPNGGFGQPDNYVQWKAPADYFDSVSSDSHWNYTSGQFKLTRTGYTATGYFAKKDGSCLVHEDEVFTSYPQLCAAYGLNPDTCGNATIDIYAQWSPNNYTVSFDSGGGTAVDSITAPYESNITLPTPTKAGHQFGGWQGDLKDIVTLTNGMEINDTSKGTIGENAGYAVTEYLVPVVGGATYTSNYEVCGLYSFDANGNFIKRESSYATTHTVSSNAAFVRVEVNISKGISFEEYQNNLTLTYTVPGGTTFRVGGNQTLTAQWSVATYTVTWKNYDGSVLETDTGVAYNSTPSYNGDTPIKPEDEEFTYTFSGWSPEPSPVTGNAEYTAQFTANSKRVEPTYTVTIPATAKVGEKITISATDVVLNEDETLTVTLQSDFKLYMGQDVALPFVINGGSIQNNAVILSITGNGDQTAPQTVESTPLTVTPAEDPPYAGTYTGTIHFTIAVTTAGNN